MSSLRIDREIPDVFEPLMQDGMRYLGLSGGRGSGKSHFAAEQIVENAMTEPGVRQICGREIQNDLAESAMQLIKDKVERFGLGAHFNPVQGEIRTIGGGVILFKGLRHYTAESIKSLEGFKHVWVEEAQNLSDRSQEMLDPTIREPGATLMYTWNPRNAQDAVDELFYGPHKLPNAVSVHSTWRNNPWFPPDLELVRLKDKATKPDRYGHIWDGDYEPQVLGALWTRQILRETRVIEPPALTRIVVGVDPATENGTHGIVVAGLGENGHAYVLEDASLPGSPATWSRRVVTMFDKWDADAIIVETNQGGAMVKHTMQTQRPRLPIVEVRATRGKHVRAEPIAALYETGQAHHVGTHPDLEAQQCAITAGGYVGNEDSPDRADALVWALTNLFGLVVADRSPKNYNLKPTRRVA